jgi:hypothetical protein
MRFVFSNIEFLFFSDLSEARYFVDELHSGCPPTIGLHSIFGEFTGKKYENFAFLGLLMRQIFHGPGPTKNSLWPTPIPLKRI